MKQKPVRIVIYIAFITTIVFSCNPAARLARKQAAAISAVLADNTLLNTAGVEWSKNHPCANDTTTHSKHDTITSYLHDTLNQKYYSHDTVFITKTITVTKYVTIHDTVTNNIVDKQAIKIMNDSLAAYRLKDAASQGNILQQQQVNQISEQRGDRFKWMFWGLIILLIIGSCLYIYSSLMKKI